MLPLTTPGALHMARRRELAHRRPDVAQPPDEAPVAAPTPLLRAWLVSRLRHVARPRRVSAATR